MEGFNFSVKIGSGLTGLKIDTTQITPAYDFDKFIENAIYDMNILKAELVDKKTGGQHIKVEMKIAEGDFRGIKVRDYLQLSGKSASKTVSFFNALDAIDRDGNLTIGLESLAGKDIRAKLTLEPSTNEKYPNPNVRVAFWYGKSEEKDIFAE